MRLLARLVPSLPSGGSGKRRRKKPRRRARGSRKGHLFPHARGTSQPRSMLACGKTGKTEPFCSRCGQEPVGVGSNVVLWEEKSPQGKKQRVLPLYVVETSGGCILLLRSSSPVP